MVEEICRKYQGKRIPAGPNSRWQVSQGNNLGESVGKSHRTIRGDPERKGKKRDGRNTVPSQPEEEVREGKEKHKL